MCMIFYFNLRIAGYRSIPIDFYLVSELQFVSPLCQTGVFLRAFSTAVPEDSSHIKKLKL